MAILDLTVQGSKVTSLQEVIWGAASDMWLPSARRGVELQAGYGKKGDITNHICKDALIFHFMMNVLYIYTSCSSIS